MIKIPEINDTGHQHRFLTTLSCITKSRQNMAFLPFNGLYKDKKVLLAGHTGFKRRWLALGLSLLGSMTCGCSHSAPTVPSLYESLDLEKVVDQEEANMLDFERFVNNLKRVQPDVTFHLAAQFLVQKHSGSGSWSATVAPNAEYDSHKLKWVPRRDFDTTVGQTVEWYSVWNQNSARLPDFTIEQIQSYQNSEGTVTAFREKESETLV